MFRNKRCSGRVARQTSDRLQRLHVCEAGQHGAPVEHLSVQLAPAGERGLRSLEVGVHLERDGVRLDGRAGGPRGARLGRDEGDLNGFTRRVRGYIYIYICMCVCVCVCVCVYIYIYIYIYAPGLGETRET